MNNLIFIDESGNTEPGYKDKSQPWIVFASHSFAEESCKQSILSTFKNNQSNEIKYSNLGREKRISTCLYMLENLKKSRSGEIITYILYKPLFLFNSFLTLFHDAALEKFDPNFNTGDPQFIYSRHHFLWFNFLALGGQNFLEDLISNYNELILQKDKGAYSQLLSTLERLKNRSNEIDAILKWHEENDFDIFKNTFEGERKYDEPSWIDTTLPSVKDLCSRWSHLFNGKSFDIIHDDSWVLSKRVHILESIAGAPEKSPEPIKSETDCSYWLIPDVLPITSFSFCNSHDCYGLQIADVIAGLVKDFVPEIQSTSSLKKATGTNLKNFQRLEHIIGRNGYIHMIPDQALADINDLSYLSKNNIEFIF